MSQLATSSSWWNVALLCAGNALFFWQLRHPVVRFTSPIANELPGFVLGLGIPWLTAVAVYRIGRWWSKATAIAAVLPLLLYSFVLFLSMAMTGFAYETGHDLSFDRFAEIHWKRSSVRFYKTNGGATADFGVVVRQEKILFPGVVLVRRLDAFYPCGSLDATATDDGIAITAKHSDCRAFPEQRHEYRLKPSVYF